jgi:uncharacterized protein YerC
MPHVSKRRLGKKIFKEIYESFFKALSKTKTNYAAEIFGGNFFTETERIMFAKRLSIIVLLHKGYPFYEIVDLLKVSSSTVFRFEKNLSIGKYKSLLKILDVKNKKKSSGSEIDWEKILRLGMPEMGKGRWKGVNEYFESKRKY